MVGGRLGAMGAGSWRGDGLWWRRCVCVFCVAVVVGMGGGRAAESPVARCRTPTPYPAARRDRSKPQPCAMQPYPSSCTPPTRVRFCLGLRWCEVNGRHKKLFVGSVGRFKKTHAAIDCRYTLSYSLATRVPVAVLVWLSPSGPKESKDKGGAIAAFTKPPKESNEPAASPSDQKHHTQTPHKARERHVCPDLDLRPRPALCVLAPSP